MITETEAQLLNAIRVRIGAERDLAIWRNGTGQTRHGTRVVRYGLCVGSSDLIGILAPHGRMIALEVKTRRGSATPEQLLFLELVRSRGGFAAIVRSVDDAVAALRRAREGESL